MCRINSIRTRSPTPGRAKLVLAAKRTPLVIHNIGRGTQEEDVLFSFTVTGHYVPSKADNQTTVDAGRKRGQPEPGRPVVIVQRVVPTAAAQGEVKR